MEHFFLGLFQSNFEVLSKWGALILFIAAFVESLPFIGAVIPGQLLIIFGGFLVKLDFFGFGQAFIAVILGAILADLAGFFLGRFYAPKLMGKKIWMLESGHIERAIDMIEGNSIKSIFIGRLHPFTRAFMPFAAGMSKIKTQKFIIVDVLTASIWAALCLGIGFVFGKSFELAAVFIGKFALISAFIAIILFAAVAQMRGKEKRVVSDNALLLGVSVTFLYLFTITAGGYQKSAFFRVLDLRLGNLLQNHHSLFLTEVMLFFTNLGGGVVMTSIVIILILYFLFKGWRAEAAFTAAALSLGVFIVNILKALFQRTRPPFPFLEVTGSSFPSGHAMMAAVTSVVLYYVLFRKIQSDKLRGIAVFLICLIAFAIGLSRVYLNVHFASDVLGGFFAGIFFGTFMIVMFRLVKFIIERSRREHTLPDIL